MASRLPAGVFDGGPAGLAVGDPNLGHRSSPSPARPGTAAGGHRPGRTCSASSPRSATSPRHTEPARRPGTSPPVRGIGAGDSGAADESRFPGRPRSPGRPRTAFASLGSPPGRVRGDLALVASVETVDELSPATGVASRNEDGRRVTLLWMQAVRAGGGCSRARQRLRARRSRPVFGLAVRGGSERQSEPTG